LVDQNVYWSIEGDSIGYYTNTDSATFNILCLNTTNSAILRIASGILSDQSGFIEVIPGPADSMFIVTSQNVTVGANQYVADSLGIQVVDAYNNPVSDEEVTWNTVRGDVNPDTNNTGIDGIARSSWRVRSTIGSDTAYASVASIAQTDTFFANVVPTDADSLYIVSGNNQTSTVRDTLSQPLVVRVADYNQNPVENVSITFVVESTPQAATGDSLFNINVLTDVNGYASTNFKFGDKIGTYEIKPYNQALKNSGIISFDSLFATADSPVNIDIYAGNSQTDTVAQLLPDSVRVSVTDQYDNPVSGITVNWDTTGDGSVQNDTTLTISEPPEVPVNETSGV